MAAGISSFAEFSVSSVSFLKLDQARLVCADS